MLSPGSAQPLQQKVLRCLVQRPGGSAATLGCETELGVAHILGVEGGGNVHSHAVTTESLLLSSAGSGDTQAVQHMQFGDRGPRVVPAALHPYQTRHT